MKNIKKTLLFFSAAVWMALLPSCSSQGDRSDGYGNFDAHAEVIVSAQNRGQLLRFNVEEGQHLKMGKLVGLVDTTQLYLKKQVLENQKKAVASHLENIRATIAVQKQQLKINETNLHRIQNLFRSHAATQKQLDDISGLVALNKKQIKATQTRKNNIFSQIQSLEAQIAEVNESIRQCLIVNPVAGTVLEKYAEQGELALPGKPLYKIADLTTLELNAYVSGSQLSQLRIGQKVKVYYDRSETQNTETEGTVIWVSSQAEFTPKTIQTKQERVGLVYAVKIKVPNPQGKLKIGMPGEFRFIPSKTN